ncbi:MAG: hypothetical protein KatS3mg102_2042 [Planctomycetota bacterium]|nr:MAG: hypothetical protein KatS3mg102_2042 [Planctomycetota bacterium]
MRLGPAPGGEGAAAAAEAAAPDGMEQRERAALAEARRALAEAFAAGSEPHGPLAGLGRRLEEIFGEAREAWSLAVCRRLFDALIEHREARARSEEHEARLYNLLGLCIRPGTGAVLDPERVGEIWKLFLAGLVHPRSVPCRLQWWIMLRRAAGGFNRGQQEQVLAALKDEVPGRGRPRVGEQELAEMWRLAASLERLAAGTKRRLGEALLERIERGEALARWGEWALGRLGERRPPFGPLNEVVPPEVAARWLQRLMALPVQGLGGPALARRRYAVVQLARRTGDPARDVAEPQRARVLAWLAEHGAGEAELLAVREVVPPAAPEQRLLFGDSLPTGLRLEAAAAD